MSEIQSTPRPRRKQIYKPRPWRRKPEHWVAIRTVWKSMKSRCYSPQNIGYENYGGRGITVCTEWLESFETFFKWAIENGYAPGLTIDRIENNGNYEPRNCRWVPAVVNCRNKRTNHLVTAFGETKTLQEWADDPRCAVSRTGLQKRLREGYRPEAAITEPLFTKSSGSKHCRSIGMETYLRVKQMLDAGATTVDVERTLGVSNVFAGMVRKGKTWHSRHPLLDAHARRTQRTLI